MPKDKLNLGSGKDYREDYVNLDLGNKDAYENPIKVDIDWDLNNYPYPLPSDKFEEVLMLGVLEHIKDIDSFFKELKRICKTNSKIRITVPHALSYQAYRELYTHNFSLYNIQLFGILKKYNMKLVSGRLCFHNKFLKPLDYFINLNGFLQGIYERLALLPPNTIEWRLICLKTNMEIN